MLNTTSDSTPKIISFPRHDDSECRPSLMAAWNAIKEKVEKHGNVLTVRMKTLRDATDKARLGVNVVGEISNALSDMGLGHFPLSLPLEQHEQVRLHKRGTQIGDWIDKVLTPGPQKDAELREQFAANRRKDVPAVAPKRVRISSSKLPCRLRE